MFTLQAPYPLLQTTTILPDPKWSDSEAAMIAVSRKLAIDGTKYTYVKVKGRRKLSWPFRLTRNKALELRAFIQCYFFSMIQVTDYNGRVWLGNFVENPFEFDTAESAGPGISPLPRGEFVQIQLEFEGVLQ
jgi:hypothetical protein